MTSQKIGMKTMIRSGCGKQVQLNATLGRCLPALIETGKQHPNGVFSWRSFPGVGAGEGPTPTSTRVKKEHGRQGGPCSGTHQQGLAGLQPCTTTVS